MVVGGVERRHAKVSQGRRGWKVGGGVQWQSGKGTERTQSPHFFCSRDAVHITEISPHACTSAAAQR